METTKQTVIKLIDDLKDIKVFNYRTTTILEVMKFNEMSDLEFNNTVDIILMTFEEIRNIKFGTIEDLKKQLDDYVMNYFPNKYSEAKELLKQIRDIHQEMDQIGYIKETFRQAIYSERTIREYNENMTLTKFLNTFDFSYDVYHNLKTIYPNGYFKLKDYQEGNLGGICDEVFPLTKQGVTYMINRIQNYIDDYIFSDIRETLEEKYNVNTNNMRWEELYNKEKEYYLTDYFDIIPYIFGEKELTIDKG